MAAERGGGALERVPQEPQGLELEIPAYREDQCPPQAQT